MTLVTATIRDQAGNIFSNALVEASFLSNIPAGTGTGPPLASGSVFQTFAVSETDSFGNLSMSLTDLAAITPSGGSWNFNVLNNARTIGFGLNTTLITGVSVDISAALQAASAPLNPATAFGNITVTGLVDSGTASATQFLAGDGSKTATSFGFSGQSGLGIFRFPASNDMVIACSTLNQVLIANNLWRQGSGVVLGWSTNADPTLATSSVSLWNNAGGSLGVSTSEGTLNTSGQISLGKVLTADGTAAAVAYGFSDSNGTGMYEIAASNLGFSVAGVGRFQILGTSVTAVNGVVIGWNSAAINTAIDVGFSRVGANSAALGNGTNGDASGTLALANIKTGAGTSLAVPATGASVVSDTATQTLTNKTYGGTTQGFQAFTGNGTFTIPANVKSTKVTVIGGGGAGGGSNGTNAGGGGGGAGGLAIKWLSGLTPGNTIAVTVGAGGTGNVNATGGAGTASTIASGTQTITTVTAGGGAGGVGGNAGANSGGAGGTSTNGDYNVPGNAGQVTWSAAAVVGAPGGAGPYGGGPLQGAAAVANTGAGGGGTAANAAGLAGGSGIVIFEWIT